MTDQDWRLKRRIQRLAASWGEALKAGNHRSANSHNAAISRIARRFRRNTRLGESVLVPLLEDADPSVRLMASVHALDLGIRRQQAEQVLSEIASNPDIHVIRLMAQINLADWRKRASTDSVVPEEWAH